MKELETTPSIHDYMDFREFLKDFYQTKKASKKDYSYRVFTQRASLTSPSHLKMVIDGQRNLTHKTIPKYIKGLGLKTKKDIKFFELLVSYNQEQNTEQKVAWFQQIMAEKNKKGLNPVEQSQFDFLSRWYNVAIYVLVDTKHFRDDPIWICSRLKKKISLREIEQSLERLLRLGLIEPDEKKGYRQTKDALSTPQHIKALAVNNYHREMIELGLSAIDNEVAENREFNGVTLPVSAEMLPKLQEKIRQFRKDMNELASNAGESRDVYQLNIQFFPLTEVK